MEVEGAKVTAGSPDAFPGTQPKATKHITYREAQPSPSDFLCVLRPLIEDEAIILGLMDHGEEASKKHAAIDPTRDPLFFNQDRHLGIKEGAV